MDFDEYVQANYKRLEGQTREFVEDAFGAGQQSKQAEIDELKSKIQDIWTELDDRQSKEHIIEKCEAIIQELLK